MDRARVTVSAMLSAAALGIVLPNLNLQGFWFDEAYTARLAALDWPRLIAGAQRDIHPPGWPILAGLAMGLPIPAEWALRLPAALSYAGLVGLLGARNVWAGVALLLYAPLLEQASQARPYVPLALGLVGVTRLVQSRRWVWAGLLVGLVASLHALSGALCAATLLATVPAERPGGRDIVRLLAPPLLMSAVWLPSFASSAATYIRSPWYATATAEDWWIATDGGGAAAAGLLIAISAARARDLRAVAPAVLVAALLAALEIAGIGIEIRKTGILVLPLLLAGLGASRFAQIAAISSVAVLGATAARLPERPDLREAAIAVEQLGSELPVISVFASEAAWYIRTPAPLPSFREPQAITERVVEVMREHRTPCLISIALPQTFPSRLPGTLRTALVADVTGLDVRVVGTEACQLPGPTGRWRAPPPPPSPQPD